jgi:diguanylate cyclase (GGDEF)-like protein
MDLLTISGPGDFTFLTPALACTTALSLALAGFCFLRYRRLEITRREIQSTIDNLGEGFYRSSMDGKQLSANPALVHLNGYQTEAELLESVNDIAREWYVEPNRRNAFKRLLLERGRITNFVSEIYRHKTRERIWVSENARLVCNPENGEPLYYEGTVREITDQFRHAELRNRLEKLAENLPGGLFQIMRCDNGRYTAPYLSKSFMKLMGLPPSYETRSPSSYLKFVHAEDLAGYLAAFQESARSGSQVNHQFRLRRPDGKLVWLHMTATPEKRPGNEIIWHGHINDITRAKLEEIDRSRPSMEDPVTGLATCKVMLERLSSVIRSCDMRNEHAALLFLDLDNFKTLNDLYGHETGDELLRLVADRLRKHVEDTDVVSRFAGDEFVLISSHLGQDEAEAEDGATAFASTILEAFKTPFVLGESEHFVTPSVGIALIPPGMPAPDRILRRADSAMYKAKENGGNSFAISRLQDETEKRVFAEIRQDLPQAIARDEFELVLQPQYDAHGKITGAEAFPRWNHPVHGVLLPQDFMPEATRSGLSGRIFGWIMTRAASILAEWSSRPELCHLQLAVNASPAQLADPAFRDVVGNCMPDAGVDPAYLTIELAEHALHRTPDNLATQMEEFRQLGVRFCLDGFGGGASSLHHLVMLPFDEIKLDSTALATTELRTGSRNSVENIIEMSRALGFETIASRISTPAQAENLARRGCRRFQGYVFCPPVSRHVFEAKAVAGRPGATEPRIAVGGDA